MRNIENQIKKQGSRKLNRVGEKKINIYKNEENYFDSYRFKFNFYVFTKN
jgi:hypothetical protein